MQSNGLPIGNWSTTTFVATTQKKKKIVKQNLPTAEGNKNSSTAQNWGQWEVEVKKEKRKAEAFSGGGAPLPRRAGTAEENVRLQSDTEKEQREPKDGDPA